MSSQTPTSSPSTSSTDLTNSVATPTYIAAREDTGIAIVARSGGSTEGSEVRYIYWQEADGSIQEATFEDGYASEATNTTFIVNADASAGAPRPGTPIAAIAWTDKGNGKQQVRTHIWMH